MKEYPTIRDAVGFVFDVLDGAREPIAAAVRAVWAEAGDVLVLDHYTTSVDVGAFPVLMVDQRTFSTDWEAMSEMGPVVRCDASMYVWGLIHHDDPRTRAQALGELEAATRHAVTLHHRATLTRSGMSVYFHERAPIGAATFGASQMSTTFVAAFFATVTASMTYHVGPE